MNANMNMKRNVVVGATAGVGARLRGAAFVLASAALLVLPGVGMTRVEMLAPPPPTHYAIGGGLKADNTRIIHALVEPNTTGKIVIVPFASGDQAGAAKNAIELLKSRAPNARFVVLPDPLKDAESRELAIAWIPTAELVYFTGGDQSRITERFLTNGQPNALLNALNEGIMRTGTPVAGTSAGAAVLSSPMFTGGQSDAALGLPGVAAEAEPDDSDAALAEPGTPVVAPGQGGESKGAAPAMKPIAGPRLGPGLGIVEFALLDTHFFSRGRLGRLVAAAEQHPSKLGIGIADNRAVKIQRESIVAIGDAACLVVDVRDINREGLNRSNVRVSLLNDNDAGTFQRSTAGEPRAAQVTTSHEEMFRTTLPCVDRAPGATKLIAGPAPGSKPAPTGAWDRGVVLSMLYRLAADPATPQTASSEKFTITLSADEKTRFHAEAEGVSRVTVVNARLDVREKK